MRGRGVLAARGPIDLVVPDDEHEVCRPGPSDRGQRPEVHQQGSVAVDDEDAQFGARQRETEADGRGEPHAAPGVEVGRAIAGREQIVSRMAEARDDRIGINRGDQQARRFQTVHDLKPATAVSRRGRRHTPGRRVPNAVWPTSLTVSAVDSGVSAVECGRPIASQIGRTARPIGTCASFHSPASPPHADHDQHGNLVGNQQGSQGVQRVAEPARLQHHGGPGAAEIQAGGNAECLLFPRRQRRGDIREALAQDSEDVRQRIVGYVDDVAAAGGVESRAHARCPAGLPPPPPRLGETSPNRSREGGARSFAHSYAQFTSRSRGSAWYGCRSWTCRSLSILPAIGRSISGPFSRNS